MIRGRRIKAIDWNDTHNPDYTEKDLMVSVVMGRPKGSHKLTLKRSPLITEIYDNGTLLGSLNDRHMMRLDDAVVSTGRNRNRSKKGYKKELYESLSDDSFIVEEVAADQDELDRRSNALRGATSDRVRRVYVDKFGDYDRELQGGHTMNKEIFVELMKNTFGRGFNKYGEQLAIWSLDGTISDERLDEKMRFVQVLDLLVDAHDSEYDAKFNGETPQSLIRKFSGEIRDLSMKEKEEAKNMQFKESKYTIVAITNEEESREYNKYFRLEGDRLTPWCITSSSWDSYVGDYDSGKAELFYFMLKEGWDKYTEAPEPDPSAPYDEFGLSMIAVSVKEDGGLHTCTLRWNHSNGGNDNMFSQNQLAELAGMPFNRAFPPLTDPTERYRKILRGGYPVVKKGNKSIILFNESFYYVENKELMTDPFDHPWKFDSYTNLYNTDGELIALRTNSSIEKNSFKGVYGLLDAENLEWILEPLDERSPQEVNRILSDRINK